jgi:AraC-like DNA-binding protein
MHHFSTDLLPRRERLGVLHDFVGRHVARRQFTPDSDHDLSIELSAFGLGEGVTIGSARYSPITGERTRELIADGRDDYLVTMHDADHEIEIEGAAPILVKAGDMMLVNEGTRSRFRLPSVTASVVSLSHRRLLDRLPGIDGLSHYHIAANAPGVALARDYAGILHRNFGEAVGAHTLAAGHLYDLMALVLDGHVKTDGDRMRRGVGAARLEVAKRAIGKRLREPDLGIAMIAKSQGVTPRYLQRLFETEGRTFSEFLRDIRLDLAFERLRDDSGCEESISAIAFDCGFSDLSHFNRSFRRRFGQTPSDVRAAAMLKHGR